MESGISDLSRQAPNSAALFDNRLSLNRGDATPGNRINHYHHSHRDGRQGYQRLDIFHAVTVASPTVFRSVARWKKTKNKSTTQLE